MGVRPDMEIAKCGDSSLYSLQVNSHRENTTAGFQNALWFCFLGDSLHQGEEKGSTNSPFLSVILDVKKKPHEVI